jgi:hypothetical protein
MSYFLGVFPSDLLPQHSIAWSGTLIVNTDPHTESGSHWLAIHFQSRSYNYYYFHSYGLPPFIPSIQSFISRNCTVWDYNSVQGTTARTYYFGLRQILLSLRTAHRQMLHYKSSSFSFTPRLPTCWFAKRSSRNLDRYARCLEEDMQHQHR